MTTQTSARLFAIEYLGRLRARSKELTNMPARRDEKVLWFAKARLSWHRPTAEQPHGWATGVEHASIFVRSRGDVVPVVTNGHGEQARLISLEKAIRYTLTDIDLAISAFNTATK